MNLVAAHGDIFIEDYRTGIENYTHSLPFPEEKIIRDQVSSYKNVDEKIIGQKLSFLALTSENKVEFYSHSEEVGLKVLMTMEGLKHRYIKRHDVEDLV